jgi:hypothetical protein
MIRLSTDLVNFIQAGGSFKEALEDGILRIYTGSQPSSADSAPTGTLLIEITNGGNTFNYGSEFSEPQIDSITVTGTSGTFTVTVNSVEASYTASGGDTTATIAKALVRVINSSANVRAIVTATYAGSSSFLIRSTTAGESYTLSVSSGLSTNNVQSASSSNGLKFNGVSAGVLTKSGTWQGTGLTSGTAGWFRLLGKKSTFRIDGSVGTYGADLNLTSVVITESVPLVINTVNITQPMS